MSNRDSLGVGDLIPQDVVDIFSHDKHGRKSQKKRSRSLGRALGWLKGKKKRDPGAKGGSPGLGPALDLAVDVRHQGGHKGGLRSGRQPHPQGNGYANLKREDDDKAPPPPLLQENVFVEASRPQYLENLHTEALEGLKMMQEEETNNGVDFKDNESTISNMTVQTDGEGGGFVTDSTLADTTSVASVQSSASTRSSRSGLTRQGSTFRPLSSGKKSEKGKTRRRHRKTIGGIPQHVQMELGLDRGGWTVTQRLDEEQQYNGETDESPTVDGPPPLEPPTRATVSPLHANNIRPLTKDVMEQLGATHAGHRDDMALLKNLVPDLSDEQRPKSLAVPWMTSTNSLQPKPPSPVMSMSPQAAYMSKIIPNAVLPPSIDVVEISRAKSRNSVRTVSKGSLVLSSPATSRPSSRACSSRASTVNSVSRYNPFVSDSSCWSNSDSSETLVSDSSTISSGSTPSQRSPQDGGGANRNAIGAAKSNGKSNAVKVDDVQKEGPFARSLSIMKPKKAPPPPSRSYSLHNKMKRRSRDLAGLAEVSTIPAASCPQSNPAEQNERSKSGSSPMPSTIVDSPGYNADTSSLEDSSASVSFSPIRSQLQAVKAGVTAKIEPKKEEVQQPNKLNKVMSPSSGYSSQDGTSALLTTHSSSPKHKRGIFAKLQRFFPGSSSPPPPSPSPVTKPVTHTPEIPKSKVSSDTSVDTINVSPSVRTLIELFNIPPHPKVHAPPPPPPEVWAHSKRSFELLLGPPAPDNLYAIIKKNPKDRRQQRKSSSTSSDGSVVEKKHRNHTVEPVNGLEAKKVQENAALNAEIQRESINRMAEQNVDLKGNRQVTEVDGKVRVSDILNVMLVKAVEKRDERLAAVRKEDAQKASTQVASSMDRLPAISLVRNPPSPSPPPMHSPPVPPAKKTAEGFSASSDQVVLSPELCWPPPPPPVGLGGADDFEFPLPPPPVFGDESLVLPVQVPPNKSISGGDSTSTSTSVSPGVKIDCLRATKEAEQQMSIVPSLHIPPPPSYTAPPPPIKTVSSAGAQNVPPPPAKASLLSSKVLFASTSKVSPLPPLIEITSPPPTEFSIPPPPKELSPPPPTEFSISTFSPKDVFPQPPGVVSFPPAPKVPSPPPPKVVTIPPPKEVSPPAAVVSVPPPPPKEDSPAPKVTSTPSPPKEVSPPTTVVSVIPPLPKEVCPAATVVSIPPPKEVSPPPTVVSVPPPPPEEVSPPCVINSTPPSPPNEVSPPTAVVSVPPPLPKEVSPPATVDPVPPPPPTEIKILAPLSKEASPPPPDVVSIPPQPVEISPPPQNEVFGPSTTEEVSPPPAEEVSLADSEIQEVPLPLGKDISSIQLSTVSAEEVSDSSVQENAPPTSEVNTTEEKLSPPPPHPSVQEINLPNVGNISESETNPVSSSSILTPPTSIPPPPPFNVSNQAQDAGTLDTSDSPITEVDSHSPESKQVPETVENAPESAPASPVSSPLPPSVQNTTPAEHTESNPVVTQPHLTTVKLQSASSSPEPPKVEEQPQTEVIMRKRQPSNQASPLSSSGEAPQKPIRKSLIITSPTSTSPPTAVASPPLPKSQSLVIPPVSTVASPTKKSPPAMTATPSMNLQEAIRLRTAARSLGGSAPRLGLHSPTSPKDIDKSPSSTASFIFSKSKKKVVIDTKPLEEAKTVTQNNSETSPVNKVVIETESVQREVKLPPPVAKKPKMKGKETESSEKTEQTAGQEELPENVMDGAEKTNGTAGTVEEGSSPST